MTAALHGGQGCERPPPAPREYSPLLSDHAPPLQSAPPRGCQHWLSLGLGHNVSDRQAGHLTSPDLSFPICKLGGHHLALTFSWQVMPFWVRSGIQDQFLPNPQGPFPAPPVAVPTMVSTGGRGSGRTRPRDGAGGREERTCSLSLLRSLSYVTTSPSCRFSSYHPAPSQNRPPRTW